MPKLTLNYACVVDVMQVEPKPTDNQRNLVRAGALIAAAIDRPQAEGEY